MGKQRANASFRAQGWGKSRAALGSQAYQFASPGDSCKTSHRLTSHLASPGPPLLLLRRRATPAKEELTMCAQRTVPPHPAPSRGEATSTRRHLAPQKAVSTSQGSRSSQWGPEELFGTRNGAATRPPAPEGRPGALQRPPPPPPPPHSARPYVLTHGWAGTHGAAAGSPFPPPPPIAGRFAREMARRGVTAASEDPGPRTL